MTTLGIYGDSFADDRSYYDTEMMHHAWSYKLGQIHDSYKNYARNSSSLFFSYELFLQTHHLWDRVVFVATVPGRWPGQLPWLEGNNPFVHSFDRADGLLKSLASSLDDDKRATLEALMSWFLYVRHNDFEKTVHDLMREKIKQIRPDALLIDIMTRRELANAQHLEPVVMNDFRVITARTLAPHLIKPGERSRYSINRINEAGWLERSGSQVCHMPPEINDLVFNAVRTALDTGIWKPTVPLTWPHPHPWEYYYSKTGS